MRISSYKLNLILLLKSFLSCPRDLVMYIIMIFCTHWWKSHSLMRVFKFEYILTIIRKTFCSRFKNWTFRILFDDVINDLLTWVEHHHSKRRYFEIQFEFHHCLVLAIFAGNLNFVVLSKVFFVHLSCWANKIGV